MRTPTVCCGSTCRTGLTCPCTRKPSSTKWLGSSTNDHARLWDLQLQPNDLMLVLHRPLEPAPPKRKSIRALAMSQKCQERTSPGSFDLFRSAYEHRRRNGQAKYLRCFEVNCEIKYGR